MRQISIALGLLLFSSFSFSAKPLPVEAFSQLPQGYSMTLSPDGKYVAYLRNSGDHTLLLTTNLNTGKSYAITKTDNEKYRINWIHWANSEKIVYGTIFAERNLYVGFQETRLMVADKHRKNKPSSLIRAKKKDHLSQFQDGVINWLPDDPEHIIVSVDFDRATHDSVYKVNVSTKTRERIQKPKALTESWLTDQQGRVRIGRAYKRKENKAFIRILDIESGQWHTLWKRDMLFDPVYQPLGFGLDPNILYLRAPYEGRSAIYTIDTRHLDQEPLLKNSDPDSGINGSLIYSAKTNDVIGVFHSGAKGNRIYWDPRYEGLEAGLNKAFPDTNNQLNNFSRDEQRYILSVSSDSSPITYFLGDRNKKTLDPIMYTYPKLTPDKLSPKNRINITVRDGFEIEAYLTLPTANERKEALPAIIFPQGGGSTRSSGDFDYWTQFFVNRGFVVLQPNFRTSPGYGQKSKPHSINNFGLDMQDDLVDSVQWLIEQGIADPQRICIVGTGYGGFTALTATYKTPELFQCAVSFAGVSDLKAVRNRLKKFYDGKNSRRVFGKNDQELESNSAYFNVNNIKTPILLIHGDHDRIIPPIQSQKLASKLEGAGKEFEYIELESGNHFLLKQKNRTILFKAMDKFLQKHLSPNKITMTE